jgi:nicotinamide-nucleotide amidase
VSKEVAKEMALKAKAMFHADIAVSTTGNAGPTKGDSDAEIGTVFIGIATENDVIVEKFNFGNHRERVTQKAVNKSLEMVFNLITKNE